VPPAVDRQAFVEAGELAVGDHVQRANGTLAQVTRITPRRGPPVPVFNLEIDAEHVYHVGVGGVLVHNTYHHYWTRWLGSTVPYGNTRILTDLSGTRHSALHDALRTWLRTNHPGMMYAPGYSGAAIRARFDWTQRVSVLDEFYAQYQGGAHLGAFRTEVLQTLSLGLFTP